MTSGTVRLYGKSEERRWGGFAQVLKKPLTRAMSYSMPMRPDTGVQPKLTEKNMIRISPHQDTGIE